MSPGTLTKQAAHLVCLMFGTNMGTGQVLHCLDSTVVIFTKFLFYFLIKLEVKNLSRSEIFLLRYPDFLNTVLFLSILTQKKKRGGGMAM